jgi:toxin ParE1/3/4
MAEIIWTQEAVRWLNDIYEYISQDNPGSASRVIIGIYKKAQILKKHPQAGYRFRKEHDGEIRILLYGHYRIAYLISSPESVTVLGVFHGAMDITDYL